jgi:membrane protein DedA with SNARE-associated domain
LELFVLVGTFLEEVFSPIPAVVVMVPAGAVAEVQGTGWWYLLVLAALSGAGRVAGSLILYWIGDKLKSAVLAPGRERFGLSREKAEAAGQRLSNGKRGWFTLFMLHALPAFPVAAVALGCGFVKMQHRVFISATFVGATVSAIPLLAIGYGGIRAAEALQRLELASQITLGLLVLAAAGWLGWYYWKRLRRKQNQHVSERRKTPTR